MNSAKTINYDTQNVASVSILVVNFNAGHYLLDCVAQAVEQADEVIVVDNASSDNSMELLESSFADNAHLKIVRNRENIGFAAACNVAIEVARGDYLFFLNPDTLLENDTVARLISNFSFAPGVAMTGGFLVNPDGSEQGGGRRAIPTPWRSFVRAFGLVRYAKRWPKLFFDFHLHKQPLPDKPIEVEAISGACMMIKRHAMLDVGCWDEGYFLHCEDLDLCMRFRQKGWKILFIPDAPVVHFLGVSSRSRPVFVEWYKHKGMIRFYRKFFKHQYPGVLMWLVTIGVWLRFGAAMSYHTMRRIKSRLGFAGK